MWRSRWIRQEHSDGVRGLNSELRPAQLVLQVVEAAFYFGDLYLCRTVRDVNGTIGLVGAQLNSLPNNYRYWGPRDYAGNTVIVLGSDGTGDRDHFRSVECAGRVEHTFSRCDEHFTIWLCRGLKKEPAERLPQMRDFT